MTPTYLIIVNPMAGKGAGAARAGALRDQLARAHEVELVATRGRGDATELARTRGAAVDRVIAVGGDGTLNEVLTGVMQVGESADDRPALGFLPGGTANVATQAFGFHREPGRLAEALGRIEGRRVDVGMVELGGLQRPFLLWCGAGIDAVVIDELNSSRTGHMGIAGLALNAPRVLGAVARYAAAPIEVTADGASLPPAASVMLTNVADIAFGGVVHPGASAFDGVVDVVTIQRVQPLGILGMATRMMSSSLSSHPDVQHRTASRLTMRSDGAVPVQLDGEPVGALPLEVRMHPGAVRLLVPEPDTGKD